MKPVFWFFDVVNLIGTSLMGMVEKSRFALLLFAPFMALFFIPFAIWWEERGKHTHKSWWG